MIPVTVEQFFGPYLKHPGVTEEKRERAASYLVIANAGLQAAEDDGVVLQINPNTGCYIAGNGNGGWRPSDCLIGARNSAHKTEDAGDWFDPGERDLCRWSLRNREKLIEIGILAVENAQWTPGWAHWQRRALPGHFFFIPDRTIALAKLLPEQMANGEA